MEILAQSTKTATPQPYMHLGYVAASNLGLPVGLFLVLIGIFQLISKKKKYRVASITSIVFGVISIVGSGVLYWVRQYFRQ